MRNTQLDSSVPRGSGARSGPLLSGDNQPVQFRYLPPILATATASFFLIFIFALFGIILTEITLGLILSPPPDEPPPSIVITAGCGLLAFAFIFGTGYFIFATIVAVRDLGAAPVTRVGRLRVKHTGRGGRGGGHWIVIGPEADPATTPAAPNVPSLAAPSETTPAPATRTPDTRGFARTNVGSLGAQLQGVQIGGQPAAPEADTPLTLPDRWRRLGPDEVNLRIDKSTYEALAAGDRVEVVYSRHLQHVYYVRRYTDGGTVVLHNRTLI